MKYLLKDARDEILRLRQQNEVFAAKAYVVDVFAAALGFKPVELGQSVDIAWKLLNEIDDLQEQENRRKAKEAKKE